MTPINVPLRLVKGFLIAVLLGILFAVIAEAQPKVRPVTTQEDIVLPDPSFCNLLEPYGWWWFFWNCNDGYEPPPPPPPDNGN